VTGVLLAVILLALGYGLHRLATWAEDRGWIYYRKKHGGSGSASAAFLEVQKLFEPSKEYVLEQQVEERVEREEGGAPPIPGPGSEEPPRRGGGRR
jgi:hypothetical protein